MSPSLSSSAVGDGSRAPPRLPSADTYMMSRVSGPGSNSRVKAAVVTAGTPFFRAPTHRPAAKRCSTPLPAGHCAEGASANGWAVFGHEPNMPQLDTCIWSSPTLCTVEPSSTRMRCGPSRRCLPESDFSRDTAVAGSSDTSNAIVAITLAARVISVPPIWVTPANRRFITGGGARTRTYGRLSMNRAGGVHGVVRVGCTPGQAWGGWGGLSLHYKTNRDRPAESSRDGTAWPISCIIIGIMFLSKSDSHRGSRCLAALALLALAVACSGESPPPRRLTIAFSNDMKGEIRSCGCASKDVGGLGRRATFLSALRDTTVADFLLLEGGGFFSTKLNYGREKADLTLDAMSMMDYDGVVIGEEDLGFGVEYLLRRTRETGLPVVVANLVDTPGGHPLLSALAAAHAAFRAAGNPGGRDEPAAAPAAPGSEGHRPHQRPRRGGSP